MAGVRFRATKSGITTGTSAKTLVQLIAAANHAVLLDDIEVAFNGVSATAEPIRIRVLRQTTAGTATSLTLVKDPDDAAETLQTTASHTATAEPTAGDVLLETYCHPQTGWSWSVPRERAIKIGGGDRVGIEVLAAASVSATVRAGGEE